MADVYLQAEATYRDDKGLTSRMTMFIHGTGATADDATLDARANASTILETDVPAVSNAIVASTGGILTGTYSPAFGANAAYESSSMGAMLVFRDSLGGTHRFVVPAPLVADFAADGVTVSNAGAMATLITDILANVTSRAGTALTTFVGGRFLGRQRKLLRSPLKGPAL